jgi:hypothetical protein
MRDVMLSMWLPTVGGGFLDRLAREVRAAGEGFAIVCDESGPVGVCRDRGDSRGLSGPAGEVLIGDAEVRA